MKKILSIILAIMMIAALFAGCSNEAEKENENENPVVEGQGEIIVEPLQKSFTAVVYDRGNDAEFWKAVKTAFESANQGVTINFIVSKDAAYEVRDRILGGNSPDFIYLPSDEESGVTEALIKDKAMLDLSDVESYAPIGSFDNNICRPYGNGTSYLAPLFFETEGLIYNKELLSKNGFSVPETWDDFIAIAEACKNKNFEFFTYAGAEPDEFVDIFAAAVLSSVGTEEMSKLLDCDKEAWKNDAVTEFAEKVEKIIKLVVSGSSTKTKEDTVKCLKEEDALFISGTSEDLKDLNKDGEKYAICSYPTLSGAKAQTVTFSEMYIPVESKEPELAKDFMAFLYSDTVKALAKEHLGYNYDAFDGIVYAAEFSVKAADNETLSDEFCGLVVDIFKSNVDADEFSDKMIEFIEEY